MVNENINDICVQTYSWIFVFAHDLNLFAFKKSRVEIQTNILSFTIKHATFLDLQKRSFVFETHYLETI